MIRASAAAALATLLLAGCQTAFDPSAPALPGGTAMDGTWASTDGVFVATFARGGFTSRFTQTNEILAQGTYTVVGGSVNMRWLSVQAQEQRSATCSFTASNRVRCTQAGAGTFEMQRG
jgi:hypothetical protein